MEDPAVEEVQKLCPHIPDNWIFFKDVQFENESIIQFHVDTRDFHVLLVDTQLEKQIEFAILRKYPERFIYTAEEIKALLARLYEESGGNRDWRFLILKDEGRKYSGGWQLKYLRIIRIKEGLIICNKDWYALKKIILNCPANKEY